MANSAAAVCLLALLAFSVDAQHPRKGVQVSVGTFNTYLMPGTTAIEERKELLLQTVCESAISMATHCSLQCMHAS